jgi:MFS family permease
VAERDDRYKWVALANTTASSFMSMLDGSIVIIAMPAIFRGIHLDPLAPGNIAYLLWMIMGYRLVQAVLVVNVGRLGDMFGRVRIYNAGFVVFTIASILLSFDPYRGGHGALWLIGWRVLQAIGGSMLMANSAAILTDAFPSDQRGFALGTNQVAGLAGQFIGLVAGGLLAAWDWRAVFWVNVPVGIYGTIWAYRKLRDDGERHRGKIDWWGNVTFAIGLGAILIGITDGIQPHGGHSQGWTSPAVLVLMIGGAALLAAFAIIESRVAEPLFELGLFRIRSFTAGSVAGFLVAIARGGLQFMLIIWLQGIWLPEHGYSYAQTPLYAGIFLLPLSAGILIAGPLSGKMSDRFGARGFATAGMIVFGGSFIGLALLPVQFSYWVFALLIAANGIGSGMFVSPNSSSIMNSVPARHRGAASGMRATFQNSGTALSIGVFFSLMIAGLSSTLPTTLTRGLQKQGVPYGVAHHIGSLPPVSSLFASVLGVNPIQHLLTSAHALAALPAASQRVLTGRTFFPALIAAPFRHGLTIVFTVAAALSALAAVASLLRGGRYVNTEGAVLTPAGPPAPAGAVPAGAVPAGAVPAGAVPAGAVPAGAVPAGAVPAGAVPAGAVPAGAVPAGAVPAGAVPAGPGPVPADPVPPAPAAAETLAPAGTSVRGDAASHAESGLASGDASGAPPRRGGARRDAGRGTGPP